MDLVTPAIVSDDGGRARVERCQTEGRGVPLTDELEHKASADVAGLRQATDCVKRDRGRAGWGTARTEAAAVKHLTFPSHAPRRGGYDRF